MPHLASATRPCCRSRGTLVVSAALAAAAALTLVVPAALAAQISPRAVGGAAASALRPDLTVPLAVLVRIGTRGRASTVGDVLATVMRTPSRAPSSKPTSKPTSKPSSKPTSKPTSGSSASRGASATAARVLTTADHYLGVPYVFGGTTPEGFDCSGFVQYVYRKQGVTLPRTAAQQSGAGERVRVSVRELRPGDLMLFDASGKRPGIDHVAIYAGNGRMIHSSSSGGGVGYDDLDTKRGQWFVDHMVAARRVAKNGQSLVDALQSWAEAPLDPPDEAPRRSAGKR